MRSVSMLRAVFAVSLQLFLTLIFLSCESEPSSCRLACESDQICKTTLTWGEKLGYCSADGSCEIADCESDAECEGVDPDVRCIRASGRGICGTPCEEGAECEGIYTCQERMPAAWICTFDCRKCDACRCSGGRVCSPETGACECADDEACGEGWVCRSVE